MIVMLLLNYAPVCGAPLVRMLGLYNAQHMPFLGIPSRLPTCTCPVPLGTALPCFMSPMSKQATRPQAKQQTRCKYTYTKKQQKTPGLV